MYGSFFSLLLKEEMLLDFVSNLQVTLSTPLSSLDLCFLIHKAGMWDYR